VSALAAASFNMLSDLKLNLNAGKWLVFDMADDDSVAIWRGSLKSLAENIVDAAVLIAIMWFLVSYFKPEVMLSQTITAGGDTASHYYPAEYLRNVLLPEGRLVGWAPGWYGGMPMFQFYFIPPFLLMAVMSFMMPLQIAFKLVTALGTFILPLAAYACMRLMRFRFPAPALAAAFTLPFLFMEANSMWGGNIPSTLAGEFAYSLGLALTVLFFGTLHRAMEQPEPRSVRMLLLNAALFTLITLSHLYTMLFAGLASAFFLVLPFVKRDKKMLANNFVYLLKMYGLAFMLAAFWLVPLFAKLEWTTTYNYVWVLDWTKDVFPAVLQPFYLLAFVGMYAFGMKRDGRVLFFGFAALAAVLLYLVAHPIGVVDIRFVPFLQFFPIFIAAAGAYAIVSLVSGKLGRYKFGRFSLSNAAFMVIFLFLVAAAALWWTNGHVTFIGYWIQWNYSGFEAKTLWPQFSAVNDFLKGGANDPRVVYEHSPDHNDAGTLRAFESLPLFSGSSTLEGLYMQSTPTSPFVFYIQSQISELCSCPLPGYACTVFNSTKAAKRLEMFNVKQVIARTDKVKAELKSSNLYSFVQAFEPFEVYELLPGNGKYVIVPAYEPVVFDASDTGGWKRISYEWFKRDDLLDVPLIFSAVPDTGLPRARDLDLLPRIPINEDCNVSEVVTEDSVLFHTDCVGVPHIVKISYYPNWKAEGADGPYLVSPSFMLVVPREPYVWLYYGTTASDTAGMALTSVGILAVAYAVVSRNQNISKLWKR